MTSRAALLPLIVLGILLLVLHMVTLFVVLSNAQHLGQQRAATAPTTRIVHAPAGCMGMTLPCPHRLGTRAQWTQAAVLYYIRWASTEYRVSYAYMVAIARCESGLNPDVTNTSSGAAGLFQFMWPTFRSYSSRLWWAPRTWLSPYNPRAASRTAAYMLSRGLASQWTCSWMVGLPRRARVPRP